MMSYQLKQYLIRMFSVGHDGLSRDQWIAVTAIGFCLGFVMLLCNSSKRM